MVQYKFVPIAGASAGMGAALDLVVAGKIRLAFPWWLAALARIAGLLPARVLGKLVPETAGENA